MIKNKIFAIIVLIITFIMLIGISTTVYADAVDIWGDGNNDDDVPSLDGDFPNDPTPTPTATPTPTPEETQPTPTPTVTPKQDIPYAGPEDTVLMIIIFVACGIVSIYTFIKLSEYSNI